MHNSGENKANYSTNDESVYVNKTHDNRKSNAIYIMEDKLENILLKHLDLLQKSKDWLTPLGLFVSSLLALLTSSFQSFLGKPKEFWEMCFIFIGMFSFAWLVVSVIRAITIRNKGTTDYLMSIIKNTNSDDQ